MDSARGHGRAARGWLPASFALLAVLAVAGPALVGLTAFRDRLGEPAAGREGARADSPPLAERPVEEWTARFATLEAAGEWPLLARELEEARARRSDVFDRHALGYLLARALLEAGQLSAARDAFAPFLSPDHPLRDLALHYSARIAERQGEAGVAAELRERLIFEHPRATHRAVALRAHVAWLQEEEGSAGLGDFLAKAGAGLDAALRRQAEAHLVEALLREGYEATAVQRGLSVLRERNSDDAAARVFRVLDRPALIDRMQAADWVVVGETARGHRLFDAAIPLLERALPALPARRAELLYSLGRAHFFKEDFRAAEQAFLRGAQAAKAGEERAGLYYQAARAAQLLGDDARAERHLAQALAASPPPPAARRTSRRRPSAPTTARGAVAVTQRMRIRLAAGRLADAEADLKLLKTRFPKSDALPDAVLAYATTMLGLDRDTAALRELQALPTRSLDAQAQAEIDYWRGRALERRRPDEALAAYLRVLRSTAPTHYASFVRRRLAAPPLAARAQAESGRRASEAARLMAAGDAERARQQQTDAALLAGGDAQVERAAALRAIYERLPRYREFLELSPLPFPRLPLPESEEPLEPAAAQAAPPARLDLLLAMGLFDDAADLIPDRYAVTSPAEALTRSLALSRAGAHRASIAAVEVLLRSAPPDFVPRLLPDTVRLQLYPRHFYERVREQALQHGTDPRLVLAIMREESRFDPGARSVAAARGLLQLIISTARDVGRQIGLIDVAPEDLYDPDVGIQLGARYVADLLREFDGNPYKAVAAYNAGPQQARLWSRLAPGPGDDAYLAAINFDETKAYVRRVLNSYETYGEIYDERLAARGGRTP